jgi:pyruvate dehydrogenase E1 component
MQAPTGGSVYLRLSTRVIPQAQVEMRAPPTTGWADQVVEGGYWLRPPAPGAELAIVYTGAVAPEAIEAHQAILEDIPGAGLLAVTSADRLHADWLAAQGRRRGGEVAAAAPVEALLSHLAPDASLVTVVDGHPAILSWFGAVAQHRVRALGVEAFGQSGDIPDLFDLHGIGVDAILHAVARACLIRVRRLPRCDDDFDRAKN